MRPCMTSRHTGRQLSGEDRECSLGQYYRSTQRNQGTHRPDRWAGLAQGEDRTKGDSPGQISFSLWDQLPSPQGVSEPGLTVSSWVAAHH